MIPDSVTRIGSKAFFFAPGMANVTVPDSVTNIGDMAFSGSGLKSITIGTGVTSIGDEAFSDCPSLTGVYFEGNAPRVGNGAIDGGHSTIYCLPGTTGWSSTFSGCPTALWLRPDPVILTTHPTFGANANGFGFTISWVTNVPVVVEASADLVSGKWNPVVTNALTDGVVNFSDLEWKNHPSRFYRVRSQ